MGPKRKLFLEGRNLYKYIIPFFGQRLGSVEQWWGGKGIRIPPVLGHGFAPCWSRGMEEALVRIGQKKLCEDSSFTNCI